MTNKYLEKLAFQSRNIDEIYSTLKRRTPSHVWRWGATGSIGGSVMGIPDQTYEINSRGEYIKDEKGKYKKRKLSTNERLFRAGVGAVAGGVIGANMGSDLRNMDLNYKALSINLKKARKEYNKSRGEWGSWGNYQRSRERNNYSSPLDDISGLHKDLEFPSGGFKTKDEAKRHYKKLAMKYHPDRFTNPSEKDATSKRMQKINAAWGKYKKHPEGFEKLASNRYLDFLDFMDL